LVFIHQKTIKNACLSDESEDNNLNNTISIRIIPICMGKKTNYPNVINPSKVGTYPALVKSGGGYFYDEVLEYRVWVHPTEEN
jgi:hypothetical protein